MESYSADRMSLQRQNMGTVSQKGQGVYSTLTQYVYSFEQKLLHFTFSWAGALEGVLLGSYKGARSLQPHFTSTEGFKDLLYGSRHKAERQHMSVTDLLKSWIPNFSSTKQRDMQRMSGPSDGLADYSKTNGAVPKETAVMTDPTVAAPYMPAKGVPPMMTEPPAQYTPPAPGYYHSNAPGHHQYETGTNGSSAYSTQAYSTPTLSTPAHSATDSFSSKGASPVHAGDPSFVHDPRTAGPHTVETADEDYEDDDDHDDTDTVGTGGDPNHHRRRRKAKEALHKAGHKIKKVFEPIIINSNKEHGGMIGGCTHPATK